MPRTEEFHVSGDEILKKVKEIINAGNARRIVIRNDHDQTLLEVPVTLALVGAVLAPVLAAIGAMAALVTKCKIVVERED